jgi:hypothetical protein
MQVGMNAKSNDDLKKLDGDSDYAGCSSSVESKKVQGDVDLPVEFGREELGDELFVIRFELNRIARLIALAV